MKMSCLISIILFIAVIIMYIIKKNWSAAMEFFCALTWVMFYFIDIKD